MFLPNGSTELKLAGPATETYYIFVGYTYHLYSVRDGEVSSSLLLSENCHQRMIVYVLIICCAAEILGKDCWYIFFCVKIVSS